MNLQRIYPPLRPGQWVICCQCGGRIEGAEAWADLDGPAFAAFYHARCTPPRPITLEQKDEATR